ncbi:immunoglobulin lambda-1 light chain-like isoform X25 [Pimephales promelas]|uniref:immunoglobulin lambda-1 light chain-like isoform X24 n=1 Tax=Pimephales promelas TaxID=90988 RepID=UPI0019556F25|nr:immunoglobulin lambda-1 light chain-like isoform X24 [Pimephales promelas]XP_039533744.1 immunoglobulin lambda-1 light chain-like isoform X25 [Pimephales promelas]
MSLQIQLCLLFLIQHLCRVDANVKLQQKISSTKSKDKTVVIDCHFPSNCNRYIHWYQLKEGQTLKRILYSSIADGSTYNDVGFESFKVDNKHENLALKIPELKKEHSAMYYCACWVSGWIKRFGTGTRLIVTDQGKDTTKSPTLTAYLPTTKESGKQTRICQATDMFPDLVKFNWKKKSNTGDWTDVSEDNVVEQRNVDPVIVTSILIVDQYTAGEDLYQCTLTYEGGMKQKTLQNDKDPANNNEGATVKPTCSPDNKTSTIQISGSSDQIPSLYLFVYAYGVMLMKNGVYFCAVLIVLLKRKVGNKKESA